MIRTAFIYFSFMLVLTLKKKIIKKVKKMVNKHLGWIPLSQGWAKCGLWAVSDPLIDRIQPASHHWEHEKGGLCPAQLCSATTGAGLGQAEQYADSSAPPYPPPPSPPHLASCWCCSCAVLALWSPAARPTWDRE